MIFTTPISCVKAFTMLTVTWYGFFFLSKRGYHFLDICLLWGLVDYFVCSIRNFLYSFLPLYVTFLPQYFEEERIRSMNLRFTVFCLPHLLGPAESLLKVLSHLNHVLISVLLFNIPFSLLLHGGIACLMYCSNSSSLILKQATS